MLNRLVIVRHGALEKGPHAKNYYKSFTCLTSYCIV